MRLLNLKKSRKQINKIVLRFFAFVSIISVTLSAFCIGGNATVIRQYHFPSTFQSYLNERFYKLYVSSNTYTNYGFQTSSGRELPLTSFNGYLIVFPKYVYLFSDGSFATSDYPSAYSGNGVTRLNFSDVFEVQLFSSNNATFINNTDQYYITVRIIPLISFSQEECESSNICFCCMRIFAEHTTVNDVDVFEYYSISDDGVHPNGNTYNAFSNSVYTSYSGPVNESYINGPSWVTSAPYSIFNLPFSYGHFAKTAAGIGGTTSWNPKRSCLAYCPGGWLDSFYSVCFPSYYLNGLEYNEGSSGIDDSGVDTSSEGCNCDAQFEALRSYLNTNMVTKEEFQALVDMLDDSGNANLNNDYTEISSIMDDTAYNTEQSEVNDSIESLSSKFDTYFSQLDSFQSDLQTVPAEVSQAGALVSNITGRLPSSIIIAITFCLIVFVVVKVLGR